MNTNEALGDWTYYKAEVSKTMWYSKISPYCVWNTEKVLQQSRVENWHKDKRLSIW